MTDRIHLLPEDAQPDIPACFLQTKPDHPSTFSRLSKAYRQIECARDECTDQDTRRRLTELLSLVAVELTDLEKDQ